MPPVKILRVTTTREARELDQVDIAVWGSTDPEHHRFFEYFLGYGMRVYRLVVAGKNAGALVTGYPTSANLMEVEEIMVLPEYQGRGLGKKALAFARKEARRRGHRGIVVEVDLRNHHAIEWYRRVGMKTVGHVVVDNEKAWIEEERVVGRKGK
jgi:ribosomal protein S18 acetylase RimI-like enzyme